MRTCFWTLRTGERQAYPAMTRREEVLRVMSETASLVDQSSFIFKRGSVRRGGEWEGHRLPCGPCGESGDLVLVGATPTEEGDLG